MDQPTRAEDREAARIARAAGRDRSSSRDVATGPGARAPADRHLERQLVAARLPAVERLLEQVHPDVLCLQETKTASIFRRRGRSCSDVTVPRASWRRRGRTTASPSPHGTRSCRRSVGGRVRRGAARPGASPGRVRGRDRPRVACRVGVRARTVVRSATGTSSTSWSSSTRLTEQVPAWLAAGEHVVVAGDLNVAATDSDVFHPNAFVGATHVTPAERTAIARLLGGRVGRRRRARWGARARRFTWWKHGFGYTKNLGMRLDVHRSRHRSRRAARHDVDRPP